MTTQTHIPAPSEVEAALRESESRYRTVADLTSDFAYSFRVERDGTMCGVWMSDSVARVFGLSIEEIRAGGGWRSLVFPEDLATADARAARVLGGATDVSELRFVTKSGRVIWIRDHSRPVWDAAEGRVVGIDGAAQDITERKRSEALIHGQKQVLEMIALGASLRETLAALAGVIETHSPEMICSVLLLAEDGAHLRHGAGPSLPEAYNRAIDGVPIGPKAGSCGTAAFRREPVFVEDIANDPLWADYRGLALPLGLRACWSTPVFDAKKRLLGTFAIYYRAPARPTARQIQLIDAGTHIAAIAIGRERTERALRASEARSRRLSDAGMIGVMFGDFAGHILEANDAFLKMVGYTRAEFVVGGLRWRELTPPGWEAAEERALREIEVNGECVPFEKEYVHKDGHRVPILLGIALLEDSQEESVCFVMDMTERKRTEEQLRSLAAHLDTIREDEARRIARELHDELGATLTGLKIDVAWLNRHLAQVGAPDAIGPLQERAGRMLETIDATMRSVRNICLELRPEVLDQLGFAEAIEHHARQFEARSGIACEVVCAGDVALRADRATTVFRIFQEIFTNILRHAQATAVRVDLKTAGAEIVLEVSDDGVGISPETLAQTKRLGVVGMRERAIAAGGSLTIETAPGCGTTITVCIPAGGQ